MQAQGTKPGILYRTFPTTQYTGCCHAWDLVCFTWPEKSTLYRAVGELVEAGLGLHFVELGEIVDHREDDNRHDVEGAAAYLQKIVSFQ